MARTVPEKLQRLWGSILDLVGVERDPKFIGEYVAGNRLQRTLAQLVAQDGTHARLLNCDAAGRLIVVTAPGAALRPPDVRDWVTATTGTAGSIWLATKANRLLTVTWTVDTAPPSDLVHLWDDDTQEAYERSVAVLGQCGVISYFAQGAWVTVTNNCAASVHLGVMGWEL